MKVISMAGITCDLETEMLIVTDNVFEKVFEKSNTNVFDPMSGSDLISLGLQ